MKFYMRLFIQLFFIFVLFFITNQFINWELVKLYQLQINGFNGKSNLVNKENNTLDVAYAKNTHHSQVGTHLSKCILNYKQADLYKLTQFNWYGKRDDFYLQFTQWYDNRLSIEDANSTDLESK
jgi:hypothetical protein